MKKLTLLFVLTVGITASLGAGENDRYRIRFDYKQNGISILQVPPKLDVAGISADGKALDIVGSKEYFEELKEMGFDVQLIDKQKGPDQKYHNPEEVVSKIAALYEEYPEILQVEQLGMSLLGRPVYAVRISSKDTLGNKPSLLFNGMHHARELMTVEVTLDIIEYLTTNYMNPDTPEVADWVDNLEIWVIPQVNPDGNKIVWTEDSWWRKNARGTENEVWGVDLNRNYPYRWGDCNGSSGRKYSQTYRGKSPASEPETNMVMNLVRRENFLTNISYHSYSEIVIGPYGCEDEDVPESGVVDAVGQAVAKRIEKDSGNGVYEYGAAHEILYPVDGEDISWMYNEVNTLSYVVEINSSAQGFQPDYKWRDISVQRQRPGWQYLLDLNLYGPQLRARILDSETYEAVDAELLIKGVDMRDAKPRKSKNGHLYKILKPGYYELVFRAEGYEDTELDLQIGDSPVEREVLMRREP